MSRHQKNQHRSRNQLSVRKADLKFEKYRRNLLRRRKISVFLAGIDVIGGKKLYRK